MRKVGLKLWSINTGAYLTHAARLYDEGVYDYIELYVVPETLDTITLWRRLNIPFIIHNAHFWHGFNLANADAERRNKEIYAQTRTFADKLKAEIIIFHGGIDGDPAETARQLMSLAEPRAILENKPFIGVPSKMGGKFCRGSTLAELKFIISEAGCGFCLDIGHAICSACSQNMEPYSFVERLCSMKPAMFHLSDVAKLNSPYDTHEHLGTGELDLRKILNSFLPASALVSLETDKDSPDNLDDFRRDVRHFRKAEIS